MNFVSKDQSLSGPMEAFKDPLFSPLFATCLFICFILHFLCFFMDIKIVTSSQLPCLLHFTVLAIHIDGLVVCLIFVFSRIKMSLASLGQMSTSSQGRAESAGLAISFTKGIRAHLGQWRDSVVVSRSLKRVCHTLTRLDSIDQRIVERKMH